MTDILANGKLDIEYNLYKIKFIKEKIDRTNDLLLAFLGCFWLFLCFICLIVYLTFLS